MDDTKKSKGINYHTTILFGGHIQQILRNNKNSWTQWAGCKRWSMPFTGAILHYVLYVFADDKYVIFIFSSYFMFVMTTPINPWCLYVLNDHLYFVANTPQLTSALDIGYYYKITTHKLHFVQFGLQKLFLCKTIALNPKIHASEAAGNRKRSWREGDLGWI